MLNHNGKFISDTHPQTDNRGLLFGDGVFETVRVLDGKVLFLEDHYFRLMSSMRVIRMQIPMEFTMEFVENQLLETAREAKCEDSARVRITVFRSGGGFYLPETNKVEWIVSVQPLAQKLYSISDIEYEVELFKDFYVTKQLLSSIKSTNKLVNITSAIYADENGYANCLLMNEEKNVIEAINGNLFMLTGKKLVTPPVSEGCLNGVMRKQILAIAKKNSELEVVEEAISPFDLQKADELFITNVITGIQPVTKYRKKSYVTTVAEDLLVKLNAQVRLS
ncbi:aminotransferase class IV [Flavobacterium sp. MAH-1]|uniref:branched-chain-amino-acid transaminase n=1 Tax=Flavobacterium agri TaxID=2743471 RepID=A0A7Y8Y3Y7_9FLAO|nr:aminotransferase class IV [Flavobacterium agri]NUY82077.1 aminotransferase class IV [Flavobacterium agri]NYA72101.1 aminotransferase class IV [Flavobacterium agri]